MKETEVDILDIYSSMSRAIEDKIKTLSERIEREKGKLTNQNKKVSIFGKASANIGIKVNEDDMRKLSELGKAMNNLYYQDSSSYNLPEEVISSLDEISNLLNDEETNELRNVINSSLRNANREKKDNIKQASLETQKQFSKLKLENNEFRIFDSRDTKASDLSQVPSIGRITYLNAIKQIEKEMLGKLSTNYVSVNSTKNEIVLNDNESIFISKMEEMINKKQLEPSKNVTNISKNIEEIKEAMLSREKANSLIIKISNIMPELNKINNFDVSTIKNFLSKMENKYKKELDKSNKFISSFNFADIKKQMKAKESQEKEEDEKNSRITTYENLAYELEKVQNETPDNQEKIAEIKEAMQDYARKYGIPEYELVSIRDKGIAKYKSEVKAQERRVESAKAKIKYKDELRKSVMSEIREEAIRELESSKAFDDNSFEYRNGDVYAEPIDKEAMIKRKMDELMKIAEMTPIERGLYEFKKQGIISQDATIESLTPSQLNDIRIGFSDNAYPFMANYKTLKAREAVSKKINTVYKDYIKYRGGLKDKKDVLSFSEYAKQIHKIENANTTDVEPTLLADMEEILSDQEGRSR